MTTVAGVAANVTTVAGISADVTSVATVASDIPTVAANVTSINDYADTYQGAKATAPTLRNNGSALQVGDLYFNSTSNAMFVRASTGWVPAGSSVNGTSQRYRYIATSGQTTFTGADSNGNTLTYDAGFVDIYLNGVRLDSTDFTASSGTSIVLASGAALNDELNIVAFGTFNVAAFNGSGLVDGTTNISKLNATGTRSSSTFLAGDNTFKTVAVTPTAVSDQSNSSTGYFDLPSGTTAERPGSPPTGASRFNTTEGRAEYYTGTNWVPFNFGGKVSSVDYLVVAGGGGGAGNGGGSYGGGGGGAGGYLSSAIGVTVGVALTVTVGAGGNGSPNSAQGSNGGNSVFSSITATGGGGGGYDTGPSGTNGSSGGSGGGGAASGGVGGSGTSGQGFAGGNSLGAGPAGAGGGATAVGGAGTSGVGGVGGAGAVNSISGSSTTYAGGGGGGVYLTGTGGAGGAGGGGKGGDAGAGTGAAGTSGTANTGGGGGGAAGGSSTRAGGNGGSGVVIIRYPDYFADPASTTGSPTVTVAGGYKIYRWTSSGSITF